MVVKLSKIPTNQNSHTFDEQQFLDDSSGSSEEDNIEIEKMIHSSSTNDIYSIGTNSILGSNGIVDNNQNNRSNSTGSQTLPVMLMMHQQSQQQQFNLSSAFSSNNTSASGSGSLSPSSSVHNFSLLNDIYFHNSNDVNEILARGTSFSYSTPSSQLTTGNQSNLDNLASTLINGGNISLGPQHDVELIVQMTKQEDSRFMGKKKRRNSSVSKVFIGDFLKLSNKVSILKMISKYGDNHILFSDVLVKVNKRNKMQERIIIITDKSIYNVHPLDYKLKRRISLENVTSLSMSTMEDNFIVIHVNSEYDYVLISNRKIEIATTLVEAYYKLTFYQISPLNIGSLHSSPVHSSPASPLSISTSSMPQNTNPNSSPSSSPSASPSNMPQMSLMASSYSSTVSKAQGNNINVRPQLLRSHSQSQLPPNTNYNLSHQNSPPPTIIPPNNLYSPTFTSSNSNIIIINNNNNTNSNPTNNSGANIVQRITGSVLPVDIRDRIEYKTEGDVTRELVFTRVQSAVNTIIQTVKSKPNANKKDATRVSFR